MDSWNPGNQQDYNQNGYYDEAGNWIDNSGFQADPSQFAQDPNAYIDPSYTGAAGADQYAADYAQMEGQAPVEGGSVPTEGAQATPEYSADQGASTYASAEEYFTPFPDPDPDLLDRAFGDKALLINMQQMGAITPEYMAANGLSNQDIPDPVSEEEWNEINKFQVFMDTYQMYEPLMLDYKREHFEVPKEKRDELGYPNTNELQPLYNFLWTNFNYLFDPEKNYYWSQDVDHVLSICSDLWRVADYKQRAEEAELKAQEDYEKALRDWEANNKEEKELTEEEVEEMFRKGMNAKQNKRKPTKPKKPSAFGLIKKTFTKPKVAKVVKAKDVDASKLMDDSEMVEVDEKRAPASLVFIGHVDAGKSTICGNLMFLTGMVDARIIQQYQKEAVDKGRDSWWLAYVMDINDDEKAKGKTVEVGRASLETDHMRYTIFDAPGHKNYVRDMIMGAAMADYAALVISARKGEYEAGFERDGQTREHAQLAKSLGVQNLIVVINKMDDPSVAWRRERFDEIKDGVSSFLHQCGYAEEDLTFIPISGLAGDNLKTRSDKAPWYEGPTVLDKLDLMPLPPRDPDAPVRVPVLDTMKDRGVVAFGRVESGTVEVGTKLTVCPTMLPCQVLAISNCKEQLVKYAKPGENIKLRIGGIDDEEQLNKGMVLCSRDKPMPVSELFICEIDTLQLLDHKPIFSQGYKSVLHMHTVQEECELKEIDMAYIKDEKGEVTEKPKAKFVQSWTKIRGKLTIAKPICIEKFDTNESMGRFTLRDEGRTIALGKIIKYKPAVVQAITEGLTEEQKKEAEAAAQKLKEEEERLKLEAKKEKLAAQN